MKQVLEIIWEDDDLVAIHKPAGLLSIPDRWKADLPNVLSILRELYPEVFVLHRLDRETSGILLFAKNADMHRKMNEQFEKRQIRKIYDVLVHGRFPQQEGMIDGPIAEDKSKAGKMMAHPKGKASQTFYRWMESWGNFSYVQAQPLTGRTHQIRVHMQDIGHPLLVDPLYGGWEAFYLSQIKPKYKGNAEEQPMLSRVSLHARKLIFIHPNTGEELSIETEMPKDMQAVIRQMQRIFA